MHYRCLWIDKDYIQFGKDRKTWPKKIDEFLDKDTNDYWMIQGQSACLGGRWTGWLKCKPNTGFALKDVVPENITDKYIIQYLEDIQAYKVDNEHCDICDIKDLKTKLDEENVNIEFLYGIRFFDKCIDADESLRSWDPEEIIEAINRKQIEGIIVVVDFHE